MGSTCHAVNIHYIFSTRDREPLITHDLQPRFWSFIGGILRNNKMRALAIGGTADHIHIVASLPTTISVSKGIQLAKGASSKWINYTFFHTFGGSDGKKGMQLSASVFPRYPRPSITSKTKRSAIGESHSRRNSSLFSTKTK